MTAIVQVNVYQQVAPLPNTLQQTGAIISQGGTTLAATKSGLITQTADLTPLLAPALPLTTLAWAGGVVTATASANVPGLQVGDAFWTTIAGVTPPPYNGTYLATVASPTTFTFALAANPGAETIAGTYTPPDQVELISRVGTYFANGQSQSVYVLELGPGDGASGPTALSAWITANLNPQIHYLYLVPRSWDAQPNYLALLAQYGSNTSKTYFFTTTTLANYATYPVNKNTYLKVEAPGAPTSTEFACAGDFEQALSRNPSAAQRMTQLNYSPLAGVTPYPVSGNTALLQTLESKNVNYTATGVEGGILTPILKLGKLLDGNGYEYWFEVDWAQIQIQLALANEVINGSSNVLNPLSYNQAGINRLQDRAIQTLESGVAFNILNGTVGHTSLDPATFAANLDNGAYLGVNVINAVPFQTYLNNSPSDYLVGRYAGFTAAIIPQRGFAHIVFSLLAISIP